MIRLRSSFAFVLAIAALVGCASGQARPSDATTIAATPPPAAPPSEAAVPAAEPPSSPPPLSKTELLQECKSDWWFLLAFRNGVSEDVVRRVVTPRAVGFVGDNTFAVSYELRFGWVTMLVVDKILVKGDPSVPSTAPGEWLTREQMKALVTESSVDSRGVMQVARLPLVTTPKFSTRADLLAAMSRVAGGRVDDNSLSLEAPSAANGWSDPKMTGTSSTAGACFTVTANLVTGAITRTKIECNGYPAPCVRP